MALVVADRVQETTTTTGTGTYTLSGAKAGFQSFAAVGDGNTTYYACTDGTDYEIGIGTYTLSGTTLARTTIIESSNSDAAVNWGAGSKDIFVTLPASKAVIEDASNNVAISGDIKPTTYQETVGTESSGTLDLSTGNVFSHAPSTNVTYVFSNPPSTGTAFGFTLKVTPSSTITQTWPASVDWSGGTAPTATASGETDVFTFYTQDGGTTYYGFQSGDAMA